MRRSYLGRGVRGKRVPGRGNILGKNPEVRRSLATVVLGNRRKTRMTGTYEQGREECKTGG